MKDIVCAYLAAVVLLVTPETMQAGSLALWLFDEHTNHRPPKRCPPYQPIYDDAARLTSTSRKHLEQSKTYVCNGCLFAQIASTPMKADPAVLCNLRGGQKTWNHKHTNYNPTSTPTPTSSAYSNREQNNEPAREVKPHVMP